jgi:O-antigen ligase
MAIKWALLWFVLAHGMRLAARRGWAPREIGLWLAGFMLINVAYAFVQRYTGIDWTHGIGTQLPPNRFAYGVYRINGFMGHPLTLAYNLMLMTCAAGALLFPLRQSLDGRERLAWWIVAAAATLELLISGSRFVLLVIPAVLVVQAGRRIVPYLKWIMPAAVAIAAFLWWEGSIVGRFGEVFDQTVPLTERFPRLVFWQLHWQMFLDHPVAGVSLAGADRAMDAYFSAIGRRDIVNTAHNVFLQALADSGLVGFVGLLGLLAGLVVSASRARRLLRHASGLGLLVTATVLSGLMQNNLRDSEFLYALWFFAALVLLRVATLATAPNGTAPPPSR